MLRFVDSKGNECAYYDTSLLPPSNVPDLTLGVRVVDMKDPANPRLATILATPAMVSPHESLVLNEKRGVLAAVAGNLSQAVLPGIVDLYDISDNCLNPALKSSTPTGVYGHESAMSPDGKTFYSASFSTATLVAVDISNLAVPVPIWFGNYESHGLSLSDDGNRAYIAKDANSGTLGMTILDTTQIQNRVSEPAGSRDLVPDLEGDQHPAEHGADHHQGSPVRHRVRRVRRPGPDRRFADHRHRRRRASAGDLEHAPRGDAVGELRRSGRRSRGRHAVPPSPRATRDTSATCRPGSTRRSSRAGCRSPACGSSTSAIRITPRKSPTTTRVIKVNVRGLRRVKVRKITVYVNGKRTKTQRSGRRSVRVNFRGTPSKRGAIKKVKLVATIRKGRNNRKVVDRRTYRLCTRRR